MSARELKEAVAGDSLEERIKQPLWHNAAAADEALGKAYVSLVDFKMSLDQFHEIPPDLLPLYNSIMKSMGDVGKVRQDVYNIRMQTRRLSRSFR